MKKIMGIRYGHDASVALVINGQIVANVAEERFTRVKNDGSFPINAIEYCLREARIEAGDLDGIVFPSKDYLPEPLFAFFDVPEEVIPAKKRGKTPVLPLYFKPWKLSKNCKILTVEHHLAHAASAFFTSGVSHKERCLIVTMDGIGDQVAVALWRRENNRFQSLKKWDGTSSSLGWFYANATEALGWRHGSDEWKTMGLAPYGKPRPGKLRGYYPEFENGDLVKKHEYGEVFRWPDHGVNHYHLQDSIPLSKIVDELGREDFSAEVQRVAEEQAEKLIIPWLERENTRHLCCAGGFFLNVKFNQKLWYSGKLDTHWTYPDPGDSGLALGSALYVYYEAHPDEQPEKLQHMYFGPEYSAAEIESLLQER
ncbi:MAG: carbamoyltransferase N-terminal domain-containing protein, partial [Saprospiraceae bacterium]|nr:carbamoyltransferase N-terminal domain-containing protein [Saprospiraceae bacterium]